MLLKHSRIDAGSASLSSPGPSELNFWCVSIGAGGLICVCVVLGGGWSSSLMAVS